MQMRWVRQYRGVRLTKQAVPHPTAGAVAVRLCGSHMLKVVGKKPAGEELLVCDLAPLLLDEPLDLFVIHSCHVFTPLRGLPALRREDRV